MNQKRKRNKKIASFSFLTIKQEMEFGAFIVKVIMLSFSKPMDK
jgi:hypothetical protein